MCSGKILCDFNEDDGFLGLRYEKTVMAIITITKRKHKKIAT